TRSILQVLLDHDNELERSVTPFVKYIDKILTMKCTPVPISNLPRITDEELNNEIVELTNKARRLPESDPMEVTTQPLTQTNGQKETSWKLYDITGWKPCPIGCLPDGYIPSLELSVTTNENTDDMDN
ncbi:1982_t:CDS:2, partial [Paraglomus occultum]